MAKRELTEEELELLHHIPEITRTTNPYDKEMEKLSRAHERTAKQCEEKKAELQNLVEVEQPEEPESMMGGNRANHVWDHGRGDGSALFVPLPHLGAEISVRIFRGTHGDGQKWCCFGALVYLLFAPSWPCGMTFRLRPTMIRRSCGMIYTSLIKSA